MVDFTGTANSWFNTKKAWLGGFLGTWLSTGLIQLAEGLSGFDMPAAWETAIVSFIVGIFVFKVPNS